MPDDSRTWDDFQFFEKNEFVCQCGCGEALMDLDFIDKLEQLRGRLGFALSITSGYRCPKHNQVVSSTGPDGPHTTGRAADVGIMGYKAFQLIQQASLGGWMTGIGLKQHGAHSKRFIHLDDLTKSPRPNVWTYQ